MCFMATASPELLAGILGKYSWINLLRDNKPIPSLSLTLYFVWKFQDLGQEARSFREGGACTAQSVSKPGPSAEHRPRRARVLASWLCLHLSLPEGWWD